MIGLSERLRTHPTTDQFYERNLRTEPFDREVREARAALEAAIEQAGNAYLEAIRPHQNRLEAALVLAEFIAAKEDQ